MNPDQVERLSNKLVRRHGKHHLPTLAHWCPACEELHEFAVVKPFPNGSRWKFNGDAESPTFSPSMRISWYGPDDGVRCCHYFLKAGKLMFQGDSTHALAGTTVDLPDIPKRIMKRLVE